MSGGPFDFSDFRGGSASAGSSSDAGRGSAPERATPSTWLDGDDYGADRFAGASPLAVTKPPTLLLSVAVAAALLGGAVALAAAGRPWAAITAWVITGPVAFGLLAVYSATDARRRASSVYIAPVWLGIAYWTSVAVVLACVVLSALRIADWAGRL